VKLRWSETAGQDLEAIYDYIAQDNPDAAAVTIEKIIEAAEQLTIHSQIGRLGRHKGTRELVRPPFVIVYRIKNDVISIETVLHGSRKYE
jgi:toxin ParE1/3/4